MSREESKRSRPNILVTGTPGTGKSTLCQKLAKKSSSGLKCINVGQFAKDNECLGKYDPVYECHELDEDALLDKLEQVLASEPGGFILEHHVTDIFPQRWFDAVFVLRVDTKILYDRLKLRGYNDKKLEDNMQCEIFQTILDEARESYASEIVHEVRSDAETDVEQNVKNITAWIAKWQEDNA